MTFSLRTPYPCGFVEKPLLGAMEILVCYKDSAMDYKVVKYESCSALARPVI